MNLYKKRRLKGNTKTIKGQYEYSAHASENSIKKMIDLNPISAGVLENQDMLGGVNLPPPPL